MVYVECYADENLLVNIGVNKKLIQHQEGKGNVLNYLRDSQVNSIGMIDEDPNSHQPKELSNYKLIETLESVSFYTHKSFPNKHLLIIKSVLETWLIERAKVNNISLLKYGLPEKRKELHNWKRYELDLNYQKFLTDLINIDEEVKKIKDWFNNIGLLKPSKKE